MTRFRIGLPILLILALMASSCGPRTVNDTVATVAGHGKALMDGIGAAQNAVIAAEAAGILPTDQARKSVQRFVEAAGYGEQAAVLLEQIRKLAGDDPSRDQLIIRVVQLLNNLSDTSIGALLPIKVEAVAADVAKLVSQLNILVSTINREVLRR